MRRGAKILLWCVSIAVIAAMIGLFFVVRYIATSGITRPMDNKFGDQHLKTAVALIELHKVRYGRYPKSLRDLKFTGDWDQMALTSVLYRPNANGTAYYVEVTRGWMGKPELELPAEFWKGTGYSAELAPKPQ
jgi:hypothetical protein